MNAALVKLVIGGLLAVVAAGLIGGRYAALLMLLVLVGLIVMARQMERLAEQEVRQ